MLGAGVAQADVGLSEPLNLRAKAVSMTQIDLSWSRPKTRGFPITGYQIEGSRDGSLWSVLEADTSSTSRRYSHTGLRAGNGWFYRVSAINEKGTGPASNEAFARTTAPPPSVPETVVPSTWSLIPPGLGPGDKFRLLFVTAKVRNAESSDIEVYNRFVQAAAANSGLASYSSTFRVVGSTQGVDARINTAAADANVPVYWLDGLRVAEGHWDFYGNTLYGVTWDNGRHAKRSDGTSFESGYVLTGSVGTGRLRKGGGLGHLGNVGVGNPYGRPLEAAAGTSMVTAWPFYGISGVFQVDPSSEATVVPTLWVSDSTGYELRGVMFFSVTLDPPATETVTVDYATSPGSAKAGTDYVHVTGTLTFAPGAGVQPIRVVIVDDSVEDSGQTFKLVLSNASNATIADAEGLGKIFNSDPNAQEVSIAAETSPVTEGTEAVFTLSRTGASTEEALTVTVEVTESGAMLAGTAPTEVTFAADAATATLTVATADDEAAEAASAVTVTVVAGDGYGVAADGTAATVTVADDDAAPVVTTTALAAPENGTAVATLAATDADTAATDLQWSIAGGVDAAAFTLSAGGVLAFEAAKDYEAPDDADTDGDYAVTVQVTDGANPVEAALTVSLTDVAEHAPAGTVWSAKMTVVAYGTGAVGAATADLFASQVGSGNLRAKWLWYQPSERKLRLAFDAGLTDAEALTLHLGETTLSFPENSGGNSSFSWEDVDIAWTDGQTLAVRVMEPSAVADEADEIAPVLSSATVNETVLTLAWSETLDAASEPAAGAFTVTVGTAGRTVSGVAVSGSAVTLTLASAVAADETVRVGYAEPADAEAARVRDAAGNAAAGFTGQAVTNETAAAPAAELSVGDAAAQAGQFGVRIAFAEAVTGLAVADLGAERVGGSAAAVSELTEAQTGRVWTATVAAAEAGRYLVRLAAGAAQAGSRQSLGAVLAVDVDAQGNAEAVGGPVVTSVALALDGSWTDGDTVRMAFAFSEPVTVDTAAGTPAVGIALDGAARSAAYASGTGTTSLVFAYEVTSEDGTVAAVAVTADSLAVNGGTIRDAAGRDADLAHAGIGTVAAAEDSDAAVDPDALTASFEGVPEAHGGPGSEAFTFRVRFNLEPRVSYKVLRDESFAVTGGEVRKARRVDGRNDLREIHIEPEGWDDVTVALGGGRACGTEGAICTAGGKVLANTEVAVVPGPLALSVADVRVVEAAQAVLAFPVTLNRAASGTVTADYATADGTATAGADYTAASGTLTFQAGETEKTVEVTVLDDAHDDGEETLTLTLSNASGARIRDAEATGTIVNSDPLPRAWLARFGRTAAGHVLDAVGERLAARSGDAQVTVAGQRLSAAPAADKPAYHDPLQRGEEPRTMQLAELVGGSSFAVSAAPVAELERAGAGDGGRWSVWGRGGWSRFEGTQGELSLDGEVITATAGADYERDRLLAGLAVAYSSGDGTFDHAASGDSGSLQTVLLGVYPYVRLTLHERLAVWGVFGYALHGELTLDEQETDPIDTGAGMLMGAFGARGTLLAAPAAGGFEVTATADGMVVRMRSEAVPGPGRLVATEADVERLRLLLNASYRVTVGGGLLTPRVEVGGRYDGGDAETGAGLVVGGSLGYALPAWGLTLSAGGQGLLLHESEGFSEWSAGGSLHLDPGAPDRGVALSVAPSWGTTATTAATLWSLPDAARLAAQGPAQPQPGARLAAELSYGMDAPGANGALTPYAAVALADGGARTARLGSRLSLDSGLTLSLEATRGEHAVDAPRHTFALSGAVRY